MNRERLEALATRFNQDLESHDSNRCQAGRSLVFLTERHRKLLETAEGEATPEFMKNCGDIFRAHAIVNHASRALEDLRHLRSAAYGLMRDWAAAMPGQGLSACWFFVRRFSLDQGRPASYAPFWIEACIHDLAGVDALRHKEWPEGVTPAEPHFDLSRPIGAIEEAARQKCPACEKLGFVIGRKELTSWAHPYGDHDGQKPYVQELHVLCLDCPKLTLFASREDPRPVNLHA